MVSGRFVEVWDQFGTQFKLVFPKLLPCCATGEHHWVKNEDTKNTATGFNIQNSSRESVNVI